MPLYELLCLAKPALTRAAQVQLLEGLGKMVLDGGGVITSIKSFGEQHLAYDIRRPNERFAKAFIWQMDFALPPTSLPPLQHSLKLDDNVLRHLVTMRHSLQKPRPRDSATGVAPAAPAP